MAWVTPNYNNLGEEVLAKVPNKTRRYCASEPLLCGSNRASGTVDTEQEVSDGAVRPSLTGGVKMTETRTNRRRFLAQAGATAALAAIPGMAAQDKVRGSRPNIILFLADDLGYGDVGCYGDTGISTPTIDRLADQGLLFRQFYANAPECSPTRTALLTGRYQHRVGGLECAIGVGNVGRYDDAIRLQKAGELGLPVEETSVARLLKDAGYRTAICGKWHLGYEPKFSPSLHGFEHAFYAIGGAMDYFHHSEPPPSGLPALFLNSQPIKREGYFTDLVTQEANDFLRRQSPDAPFFLYVPYTAPHSPYQGPGDHRRNPLPPDSPLWKQGTAPREVYQAMIECMDQGMGIILRTLNEMGLAGNTLVIFMSDNGGTRSARNTPFSGQKGGLFEGGIRVPCIARWPGVLKPGSVSDAACITMDFSASMVRAAGTAPKPERPFDGIDILRQEQEGRAGEKRALFWRARRAQTTHRAVREDSLKYIQVENEKGREEHLFDLESDPGEKTDVCTQRSEDVRRLKALLSRWERRVRPTR